MEDNLNWSSLSRAYDGFLTQLKVFLSVERQMRAELLIARYRTDRELVILVLEYLNPEELKDLFPFLIEHVRSVHGHLHNLRRLVLELPREWVLQNIEAAVEPWLKTEDDEYYRRFLELYFIVDRHLTRRLAQRAAESANSDIREAGEDFLRKLDETS